jgi:hypothetical protein
VAEPPKLQLARQQLARVQVASHDPIDWSDLALYAFYALENGVAVAADHFAVRWQTTHPSKVAAARELHTKHGLPDVSALLTTLNTLRKSEAYGEAPSPRSMTAEDVAAEVERFVDSVAALF